MEMFRIGKFTKNDTEKLQTIVENSFGLIQRQWDFYYIITKKLIKHAGDGFGPKFSLQITPNNGHYSLSDAQKYLGGFSLLFSFTMSHLNVLFIHLFLKKDNGSKSKN